MFTCFLRLFLVANLLAIPATAFQVEYFIGDINTKNGIGTVAIDINGNESQPINDTSTAADGTGLADINESLSYYFVTYSKLGYHTLQENYTWSFNTTESVYLYPISDDGIVRLRFSDLTYQSRQYCVYYDLNGRLEGCYYDNETAIVLVNQRYVIRPKLELLDTIASENSLRNNSMILAGLFTGGAVIVLLVGLLLGFAYKAIKGR